jgi:hypothetical protein
MSGPIIRSHASLPSATTGGPILPTILAQATDHAARRFIEFFTATIRNPNTRRTYAHAVFDSSRG